MGMRLDLTKYSIYCGIFFIHPIVTVNRSKKSGFLDHFGTSIPECDNHD